MSEEDPYVWAYTDYGDKVKVRLSVAERNGWDYEFLDE